MGPFRQLWLRTEHRIVCALDTLGHRRHPIAPHLQTGLDGEREAYYYLRRNGYTVVARRWAPATERGDIDLVAWQQATLCFIEVKTRTAHDMAAAEVMVDDHKRRMIRRLARHYLWQLPGEARPHARFDVLSVYLIPGHAPEFVHFPGSFEWSERSFD